MPEYYVSITRSAEAQAEYKKGKTDALAGKPCRSANGAYLDGWYAGKPNSTPLNQRFWMPRTKRELVGWFRDCRPLWCVSG